MKFKFKMQVGRRFWPRHRQHEFLLHVPGVGVLETESDIGNEPYDCFSLDKSQLEKLLVEIAKELYRDTKK